LDDPASNPWFQRAYGQNIQTKELAAAGGLQVIGFVLTCPTPQFAKGAFLSCDSTFFGPKFRSRAAG
jgi:hypothetical protein